MKVATERRNLSMNGFDEEFNFQIEASAKAFQILYGQLYSDPIKAIIRELSTNAADAHIDADNKDKPFYIHLPNRLEPYFVIRDYGTGLSIQEMKDIYTVIFRSNKTHSNEFTGCLGLGSKSPFSYVDNFIVESFKDGKHYICNAFISEEGVPKMAVMDGNGGDTDEPNGLKITVAVKSQDCDNWMIKASQVFEYFELQPEIVGQTIDIKQPKYIMEGTGWKVREKADYYDRGARIVMGNVAYDVSKMSDDSLVTLERQFLGCPIDITVNIGDVEIAPSRETLHFNKKTIANIKQRMGEIIEEFNKKVDEFFEDCDTLWDARCNFNNLYDVFPQELLNSIDVQNIKFRGQQIFTNKYSRSIDFDDTHTKISLNYTNRAKRQRCRSIRPSSDCKFYINDLKTGGYSRSLVKVEEDDDTKTIILCKFETTQEKEDFEKRCGFDDSMWFYTSSLPKKKPVPRGSSGIKRGKSATVCQFIPNESRATKAWKNAKVDIDDGGYYVPLHRFVSTHGGRAVSIQSLSYIIASIEIILGYKIEVFGVRKALDEKFKKHPKWVNLYDVVSKDIKKHLESFNVGEHLNNISNYYTINQAMPIDLDDVKSLLKHLEPDSDMAKYLWSWRKLKLSELHRSKINVFQNAYRALFNKRLDEEYEESDESSKLLSRVEVEKFFKSYPLLSCINSYELESCGEAGYVHLASYIHSVESMEN